MALSIIMSIMSLGNSSFAKMDVFLENNLMGGGGPFLIPKISLQNFVFYTVYIGPKFQGKCPKRREKGEGVIVNPILNWNDFIRQFGWI